MIRVPIVRRWIDSFLGVRFAQLLGIPHTHGPANDLAYVRHQQIHALRETTILGASKPKGDNEERRRKSDNAQGQTSGEATREETKRGSEEGKSVMQKSTTTR